MNQLQQFEDWYQSLFEIRAFEEAVARLYSREIFRCPIHLAIGHEAAAVGVCSNLSKQDLVLSYHRSHHHFLAKGGSQKSLLNELLGRKEGCSGGRGGSTHLTAREHGFVASTAIISGLFPVATGLAMAQKLNQSQNVVVLFSGDAGLEEGVFFESLNLASLWNLPLLIVVEDNDLSCYTEKSVRQSYQDFERIAKLFDMPYSLANGSDVEDVYRKSKALIEQIRKTGRPAFLDVKVFRALEHCGPEQDDLLAYRNVQGLWPEKDPLKNLESSLPEPTVRSLRKKVLLEMENLFLEVGIQ